MTKTGGNYTVHAPYVNPEHTAEKSSTQGKADRDKTTQQMKNVEGLLKGYNERGIENFFNPGGLEQGVHALAAAKHVMLSTGFNVEEGMPETDGPPGLAALANALIETGKTVTFVTDSTNKPLIKACLDVLNPNAAKYCRFETLDVKPEQVEEAKGKAAELLALREAEIKAEKKANQLLDKYNPDLVFTLELAGRGKDGVAKNMRGKNITGFNAMVDEVLNQANKRKITTVSVGDGGNEAGMGGLKGVPNAKNGEPMQARTRAGIQVTSWNSNLGGEALAAGVLAKHGMLDKLHTGQQQTAMIQAVVDGGGVDGVTRGKVLGVPSTDTDGRPVQTGVDGFDPIVHQGMLLMLKNIASMMPADKGIIAKAAEKDKPFQIGAFDSGAGGVVATKNLMEFIKYRSNHNARFVALVDFANAPYGEKTREQLVHLVGMGLKTAKAVGVDVCAMACNTASTVLETKPGDKPGIKPGDIGMPVIDLIGNTAEAIAKFGGPKPVVFSTEATAKDDMYENRIKAAALELGKAAGKKESEIKMPEVVRVAAGDAMNEPGRDLATYINKVMHESKNPADRDEVKRMLGIYLAKVPADATSLWLCCTHYPAVKELIEEVLQKLGRNIQVHDPMEYQAEAIIRELDKQLEAEKAAAGKKGKGDVKQVTDRSNRTDETTPLVITSGKLAEATHAANHLLRSTQGARLLSAPLSGEKFSLDLIGPNMYYDLKSPSQASFNSNHALWNIPAPGEKEQGPTFISGTSPTVTGKGDKDSVESITVKTPVVRTPTGSVKDFGVTIDPTQPIETTPFEVDTTTTALKMLETQLEKMKKDIAQDSEQSKPQQTPDNKKPKAPKVEEFPDITKVELSQDDVIPGSSAGTFNIQGFETIPESAAGKFGISGSEIIPQSASVTFPTATSVTPSSFMPPEVNIPSGLKPTLTSEKPVLSSVAAEKKTVFFGTQPLNIEKFKTYQEPEEIEVDKSEKPAGDEDKSKKKDSKAKKFFQKFKKSSSGSKTKDSGKDDKDEGGAGATTS